MDSGYQPAAKPSRRRSLLGPLWLLAAGGLHTAVYVGFRRGGLDGRGDQAQALQP